MRHENKEIREDGAMKSFVILGAVALLVLVGVPMAAQATVTGVSMGGHGTAGINADGSVTSQMDAAWDPNGGPIIKVFSTDGKAGIITLTETIHNSGTVAWTDWHEQLLVPGESGTGWVPSPDTDNLWWGDGNNPGNEPNTNPPSTWDVDHPNDVMSFWFPATPVHPSQFLVITKDILVPEGMTTFAIAEWPTVPEPSVMVLAGFGVLALLKRRK